MNALLEQILKRLELLEQRIERLETAAGAHRSRPEASHAEAFRSAAERPARPVEADRADAAKASSGTPAAAEPARPRDAVQEPVTERLHRMPPVGDPFPDLSLLDEKLEPRKGPAEKVQARAALEDLPRICNRIQELWGTPQCEDYLTSLVIDTRGNRKGFPPEIMEELLYLGRLARALVILGVRGDLWDAYDQIGDRR